MCSAVGRSGEVGLLRGYGGLVARRGSGALGVHSSSQECQRGVQRAAQVAWRTQPCCGRRWKHMHEKEGNELVRGVNRCHGGYFFQLCESCCLQSTLEELHEIHESERQIHFFFIQSLWSQSCLAWKSGSGASFFGFRDVEALPIIS